MSALAESHSLNRRPEWTRDDAGAFRSFWQSPAGAKLRAILAFDEQFQNRGAVMVRDGNHSYLSGFAAGFSLRTVSLDDFAAEVRPEQDQDSQQGDGADPLAERIAP